MINECFVSDYCLALITAPLQLHSHGTINLLEISLHKKMLHLLEIGLDKKMLPLSITEVLNDQVFIKVPGKVQHVRMSLITWGNNCLQP